MSVKGILFWGIVVVFITACSTTQKNTVQKINVKKELSENREQQYYYIFLEANRKKLLGDINAALALYYQCLEINPESAAAMSEIAILNEILKNYEVAIKYAEKAVSADTDNKWYKINLAKFYLGANEYQKAIELYETLYANNNSDLEIPYNLAAIYNRTGNYKKAIELYDKIEEIAGVNENLSIAKQQLYMQLGNKTKAYQEISKLIKHFPGESRYYGIIAEMYTNDNLFLKAEENYNLLFTIDSSNGLGQMSMIDFYRKKMDYDNAFKMVEKVVLNPDIEFSSKVLLFVSFLNNQNEFSLYNEQIKEQLLLFKSLNPHEKDDNTLYADYLVKMNLLDEAKNEIEYIISNYSGNIVIWEQLLSIYSFKNDFQNLYEKSLIAIDSFPQHPLFYLFNGVSALQIKEGDLGIKNLKQGLKLAEIKPELEIDFYTYLGEAYYGNKEYKQSDYYFELVLKKQPNNLYVINNYSYYLSLREEKLEYAESISKKTIEAEPANSTYLDTYAWILFKLERFKEAQTFIKKAYENGGSNSEVIVEHYGDIQFKIGLISNAVELWKLSFEMGNTSEDLIRKIELQSLDIK